ncbi:MAG: Lrp/AsnC family transcriptional regulator [Thermodesulfobacteriota bacterium]|nr:Lrp/AsnC family transcriptional regulator [Thermodesulfobacteriota bacterium]
MISENDKKILAELQKDIPLEKRPYLTMAQNAGVTEEEFLQKVQEFIDKGYIRRFGATVRHQKVGFTANAMVVWKVEKEKTQEAGTIMATFSEVTHCYERPPQGDFHYNLYTMIHAKTEDECRQIAENISQKTGIKEYEFLFSVKEFKKVSMKYY